jgi:general secretion pathway protein I
MTGATRGFSLVEVLVAFAILSLSLVALHRSFGLSLLGQNRSGAAMSALAEAQSLMARAGNNIPLIDGAREGETDGVRWRLSMQRLRAGEGAWIVRVETSTGAGAAVRLVSVKLERP